MATIANWNGHTFEVSPSLIRGFTDLSIKGSCETTSKNSGKQKYESRKYGEAPEITMTIGLNALTGVTDVFGEAMQWAKEAQAGKSAYFYMGSKKLIAAKMMLKSAEITEIVTMPGEGDRWISCSVKVAFKQGGKTDGSKSSSGKSTSKKVSVKTKSTTTSKSGGSGSSTSTTTTKLLTDRSKATVSGVTAGVLAAKAVIGSAKAASSPLKKATAIASKTKAKTTATSKTTSTKKTATTGRAPAVASPKVTQH